MILEFCAENFTKIPEAITKGATRIELCDNLAVGGTTPSYAVIEKSVTYANEHGATVMTTIRPRGGDFVYNADEFAIMKKDIEIAKTLKSHGLVYGCLTKENRIDRQQMKELIALSGDLELVFHMAFDAISHADAKEELDWLVKQGVTRILTHGGLVGSVLDHANWLQELLNHANGQIEILVGGGVTYKNIATIQEVLPIDQFHGTQIVDFEEK